ncbi:hypothetical protein GCM10027063_41860 [Promicromonospora xylanilytica]
MRSTKPRPTTPRLRADSPGARAERPTSTESPAARPIGTCGRARCVVEVVCPTGPRRPARADRPRRPARRPGPACETAGVAQKFTPTRSGAVKPQVTGRLVAGARVTDLTRVTFPKQFR